MGFQKGYTPWNKGKEHTPEHNRKVSESLMGHRPWNKGIKLSDATKMKMSQSAKGKVSWNKGLHTFNSGSFKKGSPSWNKGLKLSPLSEEMKEKIRKTNKNNPVKYWLGKKWSDDLRKKMTEHYKTPKGRAQIAKASLAGRIKQSKRLSPTSIEKKLYEELEKRGFYFEKQFLVGNRFIVDAYIPSLNLVIEADGDYWHGLEKNKVTDMRKNSFLREKNINLLRLTETEINNDTFKNKLPSNQQ